MQYTITEKFDLDVHAKELLENPYPIYQWLRERQPVFFSEKYKLWFISKYQDVKTFFQANLSGTYLSDERKTRTESCWNHTRQNVSGSTGYLELREKAKEIRSLWIPLRDNNKDHKRLRDVYAAPFTPAGVKMFEQTLHEVLDEVLLSNSGKKTIDIVKDLAIPFTMKVILRLFSIENYDLEWIKTQSTQVLLLLGIAPNFMQREKGLHAMINLLNFFADQDQTTTIDKGFYTSLLNKVKQGELSDDELLSNMVLMIMAGQETTMHLIANIFYSFMKYPDQFDKVKQDTASIESIIEEVLRFESPSPYVTKCSVKDIELSGVTIPARSNVVMLVGSANRDPEAFHSPDVFDVMRTSNPHLAFGYGKHYCLGAYLSRLEAKVVVQELLRRFPDLSFHKDQEITWFNDFRARGVNNLLIDLFN